MLRIARGVGWWSVYSRVDPCGQPGAGGAGGAGGGRAGRAGGGRAGRAGGGRAGGGGAGLLGIVSDAQPIPEWVFKFYCQPGINLIRFREENDAPLFQFYVDHLYIIDLKQDGGP